MNPLLVDLGLLALGLLVATALILAALLPPLRKAERELKVARAERDLEGRAAAQEGRPLIRHGHQTKL